MINPESSHNKQELRRKIRRHLRDAPLDEGSVYEATRQWLAARPALRTVALYAALPGEVNLLPLVTWDPSRCWVFPRVCGDALVLHEVRDPGHDLVRGSFNIREPSPALPVVQVSAVEVFLCPGLAFDGKGGRLGRGRGCYDRMLAMARPGAIKVGICHAVQRIKDTFPAPHDVPMDEVISGPARPPAA
ncbi:MAG: 5-formyltetrahydrofolate cyclo-ligase [Verrucomicrobia bacterium]|nr:5-formyltetrahydrofolate cyclo-ligase [Verrucomicrobiota bacterium]